MKTHELRETNLLEYGIFRVLENPVCASLSLVDEEGRWTSDAVIVVIIIEVRIDFESVTFGRSIFLFGLEGNRSD